MRVIESALDIINRSIWHAASLKDLQPFLGGLLLRRPLNQAVNQLTILDSVTVRRETGICLPLRESQLVTQHSE